jgi:hypothetical protein
MIPEFSGRVITPRDPDFELGRPMMPSRSQPATHLTTWRV